MSPPEVRKARDAPQGPPGLPPRPPFASGSSQSNQPPRERPSWPKREPLHSHPLGAPGASKAAVLSGGLLPDPDLQKRVMEVRCPRSRWCPEGAAGRGKSLSEALSPKVELSVHGVTHQECQAALRATGGDVVSAIQNLKVKADPSLGLPPLLPCPLALSCPPSCFHR